MKTIIEPFRIKVVEPIRMTDRADRLRALDEAGFNLFRLRARDVLIDLLTDSGTGAMSAAQWGAVMTGDEAYAGSDSWFLFRDAVRNIFGLEHVVPTHQGRAAEWILFSLLGGEGKVVPNNTHFDTTRANCEFSGAEARDLPCPAAADPDADDPFKGDLDVEALEATIADVGADRIPCVVITVTNNSIGGQPVRLGNIERVAEILRPLDIPLLIDGARFAENAYFIQTREAGCESLSIREIVRRMFAPAAGTVVSAKKDGLVNMGGFFATRDGDLAERARQLLILTEGFPTYGGMAGRDLAALAQGLEEVLDPDYLRYRVRTIEYFGERLLAAGVPIVRPPGGHAIYVDAGRMLPAIPREEFPGQALAIELYLHAGVRGVEVGSVMFGAAARHELLRLALPRRVYTQAHVDYVCEALIEIHGRREEIRGVRIVDEPRYLRHFTCRFERIAV